MIANGRPHEFGFANAEKLPRRLVQHLVTLSLPSAEQNGLKPVDVTIEEGLVIPVQTPGSPNGMIINSNGAMLHVGHEVPENTATPLQAHFINDIPYDLRVEVNHIMRRAVLADPSLEELWIKILTAWHVRFPVTKKEFSAKMVGIYPAVISAWEGMKNLIRTLVEQNPASSGDPRFLRVVLQDDTGYLNGWTGDETTVCISSFPSSTPQELEKYFKTTLLPALRLALQDPLFDPRSSFSLIYEPRGSHTVKLLVIPPAVNTSSLPNSFGIDLPLANA